MNSLIHPVDPVDSAGAGVDSIDQFHKHTNLRLSHAGFYASPAEPVTLLPTLRTLGLPLPR